MAVVAALGTQRRVWSILIHALEAARHLGARRLGAMSICATAAKTTLDRQHTLNPALR